MNKQSDVSVLVFSLFSLSLSPRLLISLSPSLSFPDAHTLTAAVYESRCIRQFTQSAHSHCPRQSFLFPAYEARSAHRRCRNRLHARRVSSAATRSQTLCNAPAESEEGGTKESERREKTPETAERQLALFPSSPLPAAWSCAESGSATAATYVCLLRNAL